MRPPGKGCSAPWPNGSADSFRPLARNTAPWAIAPSARITVPWSSAASSAARNVVAGRDLGRCRLVLRWYALDRVRDPAARELEPICRGTRRWRACPAEQMQRLVQQDAGMVAGERPSGRVCTVEAGCQPYHQQPCTRIAERRHRCTVVGGVLCPALVEKPGEPRTAPALRVEGAGHSGGSVMAYRRVRG